ncbi:MAG: tRNA epoxyqueuosine(34) reductase QueG [Pseudomonadota bacterium]
MDAEAHRNALIQYAREAGFDTVGIAKPEAINRARLDAFLSAGYAGDMDWLERRVDERAAPTTLWPSVRSVLVVGANYGPAIDPMARLDHRDRAVISVYAQGRDYHDVMKKRLKAVARRVADGAGCEVKVFVDTAPVMEKPLAARTPIGWQGKHTNLVSRQFGSWLFLGEIFTTLDLEADEPEVDHCGSCRACLDVCPTNAFPAPYRLDARRCLSYLTIEHKGHIGREFRIPMGNRIYGCDDCLAVCPWNKFAAATREPAFLPRVELTAPRLADLAELDDAGFRSLFSGSPIKRTGRDRFVRNVMIAIGNSGDPALVDAATARLDDTSPLVRAMAVWALARLLPFDRFDAMRTRYLPNENDGYVRGEWQRPELENAA